MSKSQDFLKDFERIDPVLGNNSLHRAVERGDTEAVERYVEWGINPFIKNNKGQTVLDLAMDEDILELLTDYIQKLEQKTKDSATHLEQYSNETLKAIELELNEIIKKYDGHDPEDDADSIVSTSQTSVPDNDYEELENTLQNITAEFENLPLETGRSKDITLSRQEMAKVAKSIGILESYQDLNSLL